MNRSQLEAYAPQARLDFIQAMKDRAAFYGLTARTIQPVVERGDVVVIAGREHPRAVAKTRQQLEDRITQHGFEQTMETLAYTWFNRFVAIRYMELHDYLDHGYRVLSHPEGHGHPEILDHAAEVHLPGLDRAQAVELKLDGTQDEVLYRLLLTAQWNALHQAMPFLFERIGDETELLLPANLLHTDSLIRRLVKGIDESAWAEIEIIGWLYQFYVSEKKAKVIGKVVPSEDIPAATQLFTPNWIVQYMVQNSLGSQWLATYPASPLKGQMAYYIEPAEQTDEVKAQLAAITPSTLNPEELTLIDPASGSGHILVEAYELFKAIYLERGYRQRDVAQLILEKNLFGLDIDGRAVQLTGFALMMKGRADDQRLFGRGVTPNVMALVDSAGLDVERLGQRVKLADHRLKPSDLMELKRIFEDATTCGSLIQVPEALATKLPALRQLSKVTSQDLFISEALKHVRSLVQQADLLAAQYDAVVANPPYMGSKFHIPVLKKFLKDHYKGYEKDVFSAFIDRGLAFSKPHGRLGFMSPFVWMFISSHEHLRTRLIDKETITSLVQLEYSGFEGATVPICTFTLQKGCVDAQKGCFIRLSDFRGSDSQAPKTLEAIHNRECGWFFEAAQDEFTKIPGSPVAYWIQSTHPFDGPRIRDAFESGGRTKTHENQVYLRFWWEIGRQSRIWAPYANGGDYRKYAGNALQVVNWSSKATSFYDSHGGLYPQKYWNKEGITWGLITSARTSFRLKPSESHYSSGAPTIFKSSFRCDKVVLGFLNSPITHLYLKAMNPTLNTTVNDVLGLPLPSCYEYPEIESNVGSGIELSQADWNAYERSLDFQSLPILTTSSEPAPTLESSYSAWITQNRDTIAEMKRLEEENNRLFIDAYGMADELTPDVPIEQITLTVNPAYRYGGTLTDEEQWTRFREDTMAELISYAIGCMMGRYSLDEPGLIYARSGNVDFDPSRFTTFPADDDGIVPLTDTEWFDDDAVHRLIEFISVAWHATHLEDNLTFLADSLRPKSNESSRDTIRRYFCDSFFTDRLQTYKKRPIYWLFFSGKQKAFQCLVYLHRYHEGTLARMRTKYVIPLQGQIASRIDQLEGDISKTTSTSHRRKLLQKQDGLKKQQAELVAFDEKLRHAADQKISLDLDDGVRVNYAKFGDLLAEAQVITGGKGAA